MDPRWETQAHARVLCWQKRLVDNFENSQSNPFDSEGLATVKGSETDKMRSSLREPGRRQQLINDADEKPEQKPICGDVLFMRVLTLACY